VDAQIVTLTLVASVPQGATIYQLYEVMAKITSFADMNDLSHYLIQKG
jgi:hypothetical protein